LLELLVQAAENKKAIDICCLDISKTSSVLDYLLLMSAGSNPQIEAIKKEISDMLKKSGLKSLRWNGITNSGWCVLDLGNIVVHVMSEEQRAFYQLEELWAKEAVIYHY
jgi:ribosome-associated protein